MSVALVSALVVSNLAWLYYSSRRESDHTDQVDVLLERIMRPEYRPTPINRAKPEEPDEPTYNDNLHLVGRIVSNGDEPDDVA